MKFHIKLIILGIGIYCFLMVTQVPASLLTNRLENLLPLRFSGVSGTLWNGQANNIIIEELPLGKFAWDLQIWQLITGKLGAIIQLNETDSTADLRANGQISVGFGPHLLLNDMQLNANAQWLLEMLGVPVSASGTLSLNIEHLRLQPQNMPEVNAEVLWENAGLSYPEEIKLGGLHLTITPDTNNAKKLLGKLTDRNGSVKTNADITVLEDGRFTLSATLQAHNKTPQNLNSMLPMLGAPDAQGVINIEEQGNIKNYF